MTDETNKSAGFSVNTDELLGYNSEYEDAFDAGHLDTAPLRHLAVVACMDSRMDIFKILGLDNGEAHIIRNAGGVITDDVVRSLCLSQRALGTREIILLHHTKCGLHNLSEDEFKADLEREFGIKPRWALESFADPFADVRQSMQRLYATPFVAYKEHIRGFVYDVTTGALSEVTLNDGVDSAPASELI
jgi:carbonic anhydrase